MKGRRTLVVLAVVFLGLLLVLFVQNIAPPRPPGTPSPGDVYQRVYPQIANAADVKAVQLQDPTSGKTFAVAQQADGSWREAAGAALKPDAGARIATTIALLPYQRVLPTLNDQALETYGFKPKGTLLIQVLLKNGQGHAVAVGGLAPSQTSYYAIVDNLPGIYVLERGPVDFLNFVRDSFSLCFDNGLLVQNIIDQSFFFS